MSKFLQSILGAEDKQAVFSAGLNQLEKMTGQKGVDTRIIADVLERAHNVMRKLGLDTGDTTGKELYYALTGTVRHGTFRDILSDTDYVILQVDGRVISFNMIDVIENAHHHLPFEHQTVSHGQRSLRGEIVGRYLELIADNKQPARDTATMTGLLQNDDMWYNKSIYKHKHIK